MTKRKLELRDWLEKHESDYVDFVSGCCEPGYDDKPVLLANWNNIDTSDLKRANQYECERSDEWITCDNCNKIFRSSPNSYQWQMYGAIFDGYAMCGDCIDMQEYLESIENKPRMALTTALYYNHKPDDYGYELVKDGFENGFYPGQTDNPAQILAELLKTNPEGKYIFVMTSQGQFDIDFAVYVKVKSDDE